MCLIPCQLSDTDGPTSGGIFKVNGMQAKEADLRQWFPSPPLLRRLSEHISGCPGSTAGFPGRRWVWRKVGRWAGCG